jgi:hypothetical protein
MSLLLYNVTYIMSKSAFRGQLMVFSLLVMTLRLDVNQTDLVLPLSHRFMLASPC